MVSEKKSVVILILILLLVSCFFFSGPFKIFSWSLIFCSLNIIYWCNIFWYLPYLVFSELSGSVVWWLSLIWNVLSLYYHSNSSSVLFSHFYPSNIPITCMLYLFQKFHSCYILFHIFFFSLHFSFWSLYWHIFKPTDFFLGYVQSADNPIKGIFPLFYRVFDSQNFPLLLKTSVSLFTLPICSCILSTFPLKTLTYQS